jgi:ATP-binding cassette, subfamily B, bacterial
VPVVAAWALKLLLDELARGSDAAGGRLVAAVAVIAGAGLLGAAAAHIGGYLDGVLRRALRLTVQERLFARVNALEGLAPFEDPAFLDRLRLAEQAGERAPDEVVTASVTALRSLVQAGGFVATLLIVWPPMVPLVLAAAAPALVLQLRVSRRRAELAEDLSPRMRRQVFYRGLLTDVRAAKEIRLFGLGPFLHGRMLAELRHANDAEAALDRHVRSTELSLELFGALIAAVGFAAAGYQAMHGRLSIGDVSVFFAAVGGVTAAVASAVSAIAAAHGSLLLFGSYVAIVEEPVEAGSRRAPASADPVEAAETGPALSFVTCGSVTPTMDRGSCVASASPSRTAARSVWSASTEPARARSSSFSAGCTNRSGAASIGMASILMTTR